jgi:hypothetical protein
MVFGIEDIFLKLSQIDKKLILIFFINFIWFLTLTALKFY